MSESTEKNHPGREKNRVTIIIRHGGDTVSLDSNIHEKMKKVLADALKEFKELGVEPPTNATVFLQYGNNNLTDLDKSLQEYNIPDKAVLDLVFQTRGG
jgi:hypothetical protein